MMQETLFGMVSVEAGDQVGEVWEFWLDEHAVMPRHCYALTPRRKKKIREALKTHGMEMVKNAIRGVKHSDFHMGHNERGRKYNNVETILRDEATIERHAMAAMGLDDNLEKCPLEARPGETWDEFNERRRQWIRDNG